MKNDLCNILKERSEYQLFKKHSRIRSIVALLIIAAFWAIIVSATDFNSIDDVSMIYFGILTIATLLLLRYAYRAFLTHPSIIAQGIITDIRERRRTGKDANGWLQTIVTYQYLVHCDGNDYWGDCVYDFIEGRGKKHNVGESVLFFSMSPGNSFIIKK